MLIKFLSIPILLCAIGLMNVNSVKAQSGEELLYPNEAQGYEFYRYGKLRQLRYLVSTAHDVGAIFGKECINGCDCDENWKIGFSYVGRNWSLTTTNKETGQTETFRPAAKYIGRLQAISIEPKNRISFENVVLSPKLECLNGTMGKMKIKGCDDSFGMSYTIADETTENGKYIKHDLIYISYFMPQETDKQIFVPADKQDLLN